MNSRKFTKGFSGLFTLILLSSFIFLTSEVFSYTKNDDTSIYGFRWGTPKTSIGGLKPMSGTITVNGQTLADSLSFSSQGYENYYTEKPMAYMGFTTTPIFRFKKGKLAAVTVSLNDPQSYKVIRSKHYEFYGKPDRIYPFDDPVCRGELLEWIGKNTSMKLYYCERKTSTFPPEQRVTVLVDLISVEYSVTDGERIEKALLSMRRTIDLFLKMNKAEGYASRKDVLYRSVMNDAQTIINSLRKIKNEKPALEELTESLRKILVDEFYSQLDATVAAFEKLPPGNMSPSPSNSSLCKQECEKLNLILQSMEKKARLITRSE